MTGPGPIPGLVDLSDSSLDNQLNTAKLQTALLSNNPVAASYAANVAATQTYTPSNEITIKVFDKFYNLIEVVADYKSAQVTWERNAVAGLNFVLKQTDPLVPVVMNCWQVVVPVQVKTGYMSWSGQVDHCDYEYKDGLFDITVYCNSDYSWFDCIMVWPDPALPIQAQFPSEAFYIGPAVTCVKTMIQENVFRLQSGLWEIVNNALSLDLNWESWFGTLLESNGNLSQMLLTPIVVVPTNPLTDTSEWTSISGRMDKISTLVQQVVKDNGLLLTADLWLPGDPQPKGLAVNLTAPTIVVDCKDMSGITGPTATLIDGIISDVVDLQQSILGNVLEPFLNPGNLYSPEGINIAPVLGVNFVQPWVIFTDNPRSGLTEFKATAHSPVAYSILGGGQSPQWLNDLINETLSWLIDSIEIAVGFTGIPDDLLNGTFDNIVLAFQQIENFNRRVLMGPYGHPEYFTQTGQSAYTLDEWFALVEAMWDTRGFTAITLSFDDGYPYTLGKDIFIGSLASFVATNSAITFATGANTPSNMYTDYIYRATLTDDREHRRKFTQIMIGDAKGHDDPAVKVSRKIEALEKFVQIVTLSPTN